MRQDCSAYAEEPLRTVGLLEAAHQYSLQDMCPSTGTPIPTLLPTQEWQFKNLMKSIKVWYWHGMVESWYVLADMHLDIHMYIYTYEY